MPPPDLAAAPAEPFPHWQVNMNALGVGAFCNTLGYTACIPYLPLIVRELGVTEHLETWVGLITGGFFATGFLLAPVWGAMADHYGRKTMVLRAGLGMGVGFGLLALSSRLDVFVVVFLLAGLANGYVPAATALVATNTPTQTLGRALSRVHAGALLGTTVGPALGMLLTGVLPAYRLLFWVSCLSSLSAGTVALLFAREPPVRSEGPFRFTVVADTRLILRQPNLWVLFLVSFVFNLTMFGSAPVVSLFTLELASDPALLGSLSLETWVGLVTLSMMVASAASLPFWGRALDRYEPRRVLVLALGAGLAGSLLTPFVRTLPELTGARMVLGLLGMGILPAAVRLIKEDAPPGMDARTLALGTALQMLGNGAGPFVAGLIAPLWGMRAFFFWNAGMIALALALWGRLGLRGGERVRP